MKLYTVTNKLGTWWVIADHPSEAENKVLEFLSNADYGFHDERKATTIQLIAEGATDYKFISGKFLIINP